MKIWLIGAVQSLYPVALALLFAVAVGGCDLGTENAETSQGVQTASLLLSVEFPAATTTSLTSVVADDVVSVTVDVLNPPPDTIDRTVDMVLGLVIPGVWSVEIPDLPVGVTLGFVTHAFDSQGTEIFTGIISDVVLDSSVTDPVVTINIDKEFPFIEFVDSPGGTIGLPIQILVGISGEPNEPLHVDFPLQTPTNSFIPLSASFLTDANGAVSPVPAFDYAPPANPGNYPQTVRLADDQGFTVEQNFDISVFLDGTVIIKFGPTVTGFNASRTGDSVTWTATVTDEDPANLTFAWSFTQDAGLSFTSFDNAGGVSDANPGVMVGYEETVEGTITLTVTDSDGLSTTVTFPLPAGQFPDGLWQL